MRLPGVDVGAPCRHRADCGGDTRRHGHVAALVREGRDREDADTPGGQLTFLGLLGLMVGAINLALILLEGSYAIFVEPCG